MQTEPSTLKFWY